MKISPFYYSLIIEEEKSFSKAAKRIGISQPALSSHITKLEEKLNGFIFDRTTNPISVTDIGRIYLDFVRESLILEEGMENRLSELSELTTGRLEIGGASSFTAGYLSAAQSEFMKLYPGVSVHIVDAKVPELREMTLKGELDFFITGEGIDNSGLELKPFAKERILLCVPEDWEINKKLEGYRVPKEDVFSGADVNKKYKEVPISFLEDCPFVLLDDDLSVRHIANTLFEKNSVKPKETLVVGQIMTSIAMTAAGAGICFASDNNIRSGDRCTVPAFYAFDEEIAVRKMCVAWRKNKYMSKACREYIRILCGLFEGEKQ